MIENEQQLQTSHQALEEAYLSVAALRRDVLVVNPQRYTTSAQAPLSEVHKLRVEIEAYLGLDEAEPLPEPPPFIIENDEQLRGTHRALGHLYRALASLRKDLPSTARNYRLYAEGTIEEILKLQAEIDAYLGLPDAVPQAVTLREIPPEFGPPKPS